MTTEAKKGEQFEPGRYFLPLSVAPLPNPFVSDQDALILDADTGHIARVSSREFALAAVEAINATPQRDSLRAQIETMTAIAAVRERRLATAIAQRDELLRVLGDECDCPAPANSAPQDQLSVRACMNRKECGCCFGAAIASIESQKGGEG